MSLANTSLYPALHAKTIHLIRHGQACHNVAGDHDYSAYLRPEFLDASLTPMGWAQAAALRKHLAGLSKPLPGGPIELVVVSPLMRTLQTAVGVFGGGPAEEDGSKDSDILMKAGAGGSSVGAISAAGVPPFLAEELCREHLGRNPCDKRQPISVYKPLFPAIDFSGVATDEDTWWFPQPRESHEELSERARKFVLWLMGRKEQTIAVVTHSSFLTHLVTNFGNDVSPFVKKGFEPRFLNCQLRTYVLVDRSGLMENSGGLPDNTNFIGFAPGSAGSDLADPADTTEAGK